MLYHAGEGGPWKIVGAHRGGGSERFEQTLSAYKNALDQGANYMELDVLITKDNVVVCCHDSDLARLCGDQYAGQLLEDTNFAELPPYQRTIPYDDRVGEYTQTREDDDCLWLTLETLFANMPSTVMYSIDFKFLRELSSVQLVHAIIKKYGVERRTMWASGRLPACPNSVRTASSLRFTTLHYASLRFTS